MSQHVYGVLSKRARSLLSRSEGYELEFKETVQALEPEDIVAFANAPQGGVVLIGVREVETEDGRQCGEIVGCPVGDGEKLSVLNRAESCVPPIAVEFIVENADRQPFFRRRRSGAKRRDPQWASQALLHRRRDLQGAGQRAYPAALASEAAGDVHGE